MHCFRSLTWIVKPSWGTAWEWGQKELEETGEAHILEHKYHWSNEEKEIIKSGLCFAWKIWADISYIFETYSGAETELQNFCFWFWITNLFVIVLTKEFL